jgi:hypothetical protein
MRRCPGVAGRFAQDHLLKVLALAEVIVDLPDDCPRGAAAGANLACTRPLGDVPAFVALEVCLAVARHGLELGPGAATVEHDPTGEILPRQGARRSLDKDDGIARVGHNRLHDLRGGGQSSEMVPDVGGGRSRPPIIVSPATT